jgi:hypothetical protein
LILTDRDECREGVEVCPFGEDCRNTLGSFECFCTPGQKRRAPDQKCVPDDESDLSDSLFADRTKLSWAKNEIQEAILFGQSLLNT